jgi:hypothetical protein
MPTDPIIIIMDGGEDVQQPPSGDVQYAGGVFWAVVGLILIVVKISVKLRKAFDLMRATS